MTSDDPGRIPPSGGRGRGLRTLSPMKRPKRDEEPLEDPPVSEATDVDPPEAGAQQSANGGSRPQRKRHPLGIRRLDDLLRGGLEQGGFTLLYGPPYLGKEHLARRWAVEGAKAGVPVIFIHTDVTAKQLQEELLAIDPAIQQAIQKGLLYHVDCYSRSIEADESRAPHVEYVDGAMDLNGISVTVNAIQRKLSSHYDQHLVILDSMSTIITYSNAQTAFRFLQVLLGKSRLVGATCMALLDEGMHTEAEVKSFRHLMTGSLDVRDHSNKYQLRVLGLSDQEGLGWIDYRYRQGSFDLTGSFAPGRIR